MLYIFIYVYVRTCILEYIEREEVLDNKRKNRERMQTF